MGRTSNQKANIKVVNLLIIAYINQAQAQHGLSISLGLGKGLMGV